MRPRPFRGVLLYATCSECGNRLWGMTFDIAGPGEHEPGLPFSVAICGRCDRPAEPGMEPRLIHPETREPIPEPASPWYTRDWFVGLIFAVILIGAVLTVLRG